MASLPNPTDIRYGGFYLPVFSLLYIHQEIGLPVELPLARILLTEEKFPFLLGIVFLGALIGHGASRSIYGIDGAKTNPKNRLSVLWYHTLFSVKKNPGKPPKTADELREKFWGAIDGFVSLSNRIKALVVLIRLGRFSVIWPAKLTLILTALITTGVLAYHALEGDLQPLGLLLLTGQIVFFMVAGSLGAFQPLFLWSPHLGCI